MAALSLAFWIFCFNSEKTSANPRGIAIEEGDLAVGEDRFFVIQKTLVHAFAL